MSKPVYDIHGQPIKVGSLVACPDLHPRRLFKGRVARIGEGYKSVGGVYVAAGERVVDTWPEQCVVLEEPVWPNA